MNYFYITEYVSELAVACRFLTRHVCVPVCAVAHPHHPPHLSVCSVWSVLSAISVESPELTCLSSACRKEEL